MEPATELKLFYQVCYYKKMDQVRNISYINHKHSVALKINFLKVTFTQNQFSCLETMLGFCDFQRSSVLLNVSGKSRSVTILGTSLAPLQDYQVKVRSLVVLGQGSLYEGIPSEWTDPEAWTSNEGVYSTLTVWGLLPAVCSFVFSERLQKASKNPADMNK